MNNVSLESNRVFEVSDLGDGPHTKEDIGQPPLTEGERESKKSVFPLFNVKVCEDEYTVGVDTDPLSFGVPSIDPTESVSSSSEYSIASLNTVLLPENTNTNISGIRIFNGDTLEIIPALKDEEDSHEIILHEDERTNYFKPRRREPEKVEPELRVSLYNFIKSLSQISSVRVPEATESLTGIPTNRKIEELYYTFLNVSEDESVLLLFDDAHLPSIRWFNQFHSESFSKEFFKAFKTLEYRSALNESLDESSEGFLVRLQRKAQIIANNVWGFDFNIDERGVNIERPISLPHLVVEDASINEIRQYYESVMELLYGDLDTSEAPVSYEEVSTEDLDEEILFEDGGIVFKEVVQFKAGTEIKNVKNGLIHLKNPDGREVLSLLVEDGSIEYSRDVIRGWEGSNLLTHIPYSKKFIIWNPEKGICTCDWGKWRYNFELPAHGIERIIDADVSSSLHPILLAQTDENYSSSFCLIEDYGKVTLDKYYNIRISNYVNSLCNLYNGKYFLFNSNSPDYNLIYEKNDGRFLANNNALSKELRSNFQVRSVSNIGGFFAVSGVKKSEGETFVVNLCSSDLSHVTAQIEMDVIPKDMELDYSCKLIGSHDSSQVYGILHPQSGGIEAAVYFTFDFQPIIEQESSATFIRKISELTKNQVTRSFYNSSLIRFISKAGVLQRYNTGYPISSYNIEHIEGDRVRLYIGRGVINLEH